MAAEGWPFPIHILVHSAGVMAELVALKERASYYSGIVTLGPEHHTRLFSEIGVSNGQISATMAVPQTAAVGAMVARQASARGTPYMQASVRATLFTLL